jgi:hypothetical protein
MDARVKPGHDGGEGVGRRRKCNGGLRFANLP